MEENINEVELSTTINDLISKMPNWLIQWGMTVITIIIFIALTFTYIIKYPDVVEGKVVVTTLSPPVVLSSTQSGVIKKIYFDNKSYVEKGDIVAELNSTTTLSEIRKLEQYIKTIERALQEEKELQTVDLNMLFLGEKQLLLSELNRNIEQYNSYCRNADVTNNINLIAERIRYKEDYRALLKDLLKAATNKLELERENFNIQEKLYLQKVISKSDFLENRLNFLTKEDQIEEYKKSIIQNKMDIHQDKMEIELLKASNREKIEQLKNVIKSSLASIGSFKEEWYRHSVVISPKDGTLNYLKNFYGNEYAAAGSPLFTVNSGSSKLVAYSFLPPNRYGKIKVNQKVRIKLDNFPHEEFGYLTGKVVSVSHFSHEDQYLTTINLENGTKTNTNKELNLVSEVRGTAEIITEEARLIERVFFQINKIQNQL